ncbi:flavonol 3-O-glucosyltransferase [Vigna unguiculata]|uniref:Glycosyltransferase n=1 Tax=Vigna unguiculata TaxID=3917 RepID=A0A4D6L6S7_VIGUN|nr:flavonol 3-O-glucosyltransferase [Vigna unguiculata]
MSSDSTKDKHVAVFPFPFGTHVVPILNLVLRLSQATPSCTFSFISTHKCNALHFAKPHNPSNIKPYSINDGIPYEGHPLANHPIEKLNFFLSTGPENLRKGIQMAEEDTKKKVTCIISDAFVSSSLLVAQSLNVPWIAFWPPMSCTLSLYFYIDFIRQKFEDCDEDARFDISPGLPKMCVKDIPQDLLFTGEKEMVFSRTLVSLGEVLPQAKAVVMNFFEELDPPLFVEDMRSKLQCMLYVVPVRFPILLSGADPSGCLSWLDSNPSMSVVYVSFGTVVTPPPHEIVAVAEALEESGFPFVWSLKESVRGLLPDGFEKRTLMRGKVVPWVPQTQLLGHDSVGVFVTHCGSKSVTESVSSGVPMICRPFYGDQMVGARVIEDVWKVGVTIEGRVFNKNGLIRSLNLILVQEDGKKIRDNVLEMKKTVEDASTPEGLSASNFKTLVEVISSSSKGGESL